MIIRPLFPLRSAELFRLDLDHSALDHNGGDCRALACGPKHHVPAH